MIAPVNSMGKVGLASCGNFTVQVEADSEALQPSPQSADARLPSPVRRNDDRRSAPIRLRSWGNKRRSSSPDCAASEPRITRHLLSDVRLQTLLRYQTLPGAHLVGLIWPASSAGAGRRILRGVQSARANSDGAYGRRLPRFAGYHRCQCRRAGRLRRTPDATRRDPEVGGRSARRHKRRISTQSLDTGSATQARCRCRRCCTAISGQLGTGSGAGGR
jgi:hypothetical protein